MSEKSKADDLFSTGRKLYHEKDFPAALEALKSALTLYQQIGRKEKAGITSTYIGQVLEGLGKDQEALVSYSQAVQLLRESRELRELGMMGKLSYEKKIPEEYLFASVGQREALLQGLCDTDGYVRTGSSIEYSTSSVELCLQVRDLVRSLGGIATVSVREKPVYTYKGQKKFGRTNYRINIRFVDSNIIPVSSRIL